MRSQGAGVESGNPRVTLMMEGCPSCDSVRTTQLGKRTVASIRDYKDLIVWQRAGELEACCNEILSRLTGPARRDMAAQIRRAANSIGANIAEGHSRPGRGQFLQFLGYARASLKELESHLLSLERLGHASGPRLNRALALCEECSKMLSVLHRRLQEGGA